ncbi:hypothetical protein BT69DRAFT_657296 [Atractiella rhizophila]|nr:hypothetical protein BT69DRAFT_657296 [Atractiella rhizophila]
MRPQGKIYATKAFLQKRSNYFVTMFQSDFTEGTGTIIEPTVVEVNDTSYRTFSSMIRYIYTEKVNFTTVFSLEPYRHPPDQEEPVEDIDEQYFIAAYVDWHTKSVGDKKVCDPMEMFLLADKLQMEDLRSRSLDAVSRNLTAVAAYDLLFGAISIRFKEVRDILFRHVIANWAVTESPSYLYQQILPLASISGCYHRLSSNILIDRQEQLKEVKNINERLVAHWGETIPPGKTVKVKCTHCDIKPAGCSECRGYYSSSAKVVLVDA